MTRPSQEKRNAELDRSPEVLLHMVPVRHPEGPYGSFQAGAAPSATLQHPSAPDIGKRQEGPSQELAVASARSVLGPCRTDSRALNDNVQHVPCPLHVERCKPLKAAGG